MDGNFNENDISHVVDADKAHVWHHLIQHKQFETNDPRIILEGKGSHFDPEIVEGFMAVQEEFRQIALQFADFDEEKEALAEPYKP